MENLNRTIVISSEIDERVAGEVIAFIDDINAIDDYLSRTSVGYQPEPIRLKINSGGGSATDGFAIIGAIEESQTPVITYAMGMVGSMALAIYVAGHIRASSRHTRFLYHGVQYSMLGRLKEHKNRQEEVELIQRMYDILMEERTKFPMDEMKKIQDSGIDFTFSAREAFKLGIVDKVAVRPDYNFAIAEDEELEKAE
jgi:ATP-dependent protease ClpP protease subunit